MVASVNNGMIMGFLPYTNCRISQPQKTRGTQIREMSKSGSEPRVEVYLKWPIYSGFTHWTWWFSIVMLVYQRVGGKDYSGVILPSDGNIFGYPDIQQSIIYQLYIPIISKGFWASNIWRYNW